MNTPANGGLPDPWTLPLKTQLLYRGSVVADYGLRTGLASLVAAGTSASVLDRGTLQERQRLEFYAALPRDPGLIFQPPEPVTVERTLGANPGIDGHVELLRFNSHYQPINPELRRRYGRYANNQIARAQHWRHHDEPRQTLFVIHGFGASPAWFNSAFFSLKKFFAEGWDIVLFTLPFHGSRRSRGAPFNGVELFAHGIAVFTEAIIHAIHDLRALVGHLLDQGAPRVGATGLSLGGYTTALAAALEPRLDFAIPNSAVTWFPGLVESWFPVNLTGRALRRLESVSTELLTGALSLHSPLSYQPQVPNDRLLIVAGLGDRLAPPEQSMRLWHHWDQPELRWFPGSHVIHFGRQEYLRAMRAMMAETRALAQ
jgi:pimeloyl-ACP methyl ester carboxylesterase